MPISNNQSIDISSGFESISSRISALQAYNESRQGQIESDKTRGDSLARSLEILAGQKSSVEANQSRNKRNTSKARRRIRRDRGRRCTTTTCFKRTSVSILIN